MQRAGQHDQADQQLNLNDLQRTVQNQRESVNSKMAPWSHSATKATEQRERTVFWLTIAATTSTVLLGMTVAALITNRLSRPVRSLAIAMRDVQQGNLNIELPVASTDEVGRLTDALFFRKGIALQGANEADHWQVYRRFQCNPAASQSHC